MSFSIGMLVYLTGFAANAYFSNKLFRKPWVRALNEDTADAIVLSSILLSWLVPLYLVASKVREYDQV